ncbi:transposase [Nostoc sp. FACHB-888]|uniref:transposase n=1 Tax=Nostoc sp. FACHB-888 TaxID=2692842 RepID=UPI00322070C9
MTALLAAMRYILKAESNDRRGARRKLYCIIAESAVVGDKGYSSANIRRHLQRRGIRFTIPLRSNERRRGKFDKSIYRQRNRVERCFNRLKQFRRIATRYEKKADNYLAMLTLASIYGYSFKTRPSSNH